MVEIARALSIDARLLILDEPTSSLTDDEVESLFAVVRKLRDDGVVDDLRLASDRRGLRARRSHLRIAGRPQRRRGRDGGADPGTR